MDNFAVLGEVAFEGVRPRLQVDDGDLVSKADEHFGVIDADTFYAAETQAIKHHGNVHIRTHPFRVACYPPFYPSEAAGVFGDACSGGGPEGMVAYAKRQKNCFVSPSRSSTLNMPTPIRVLRRCPCGFKKPRWGLLR